MMLCVVCNVVVMFAVGACVEGAAGVCQCCTNRVWDDQKYV